ncbi:MAG: hypothetical protein WDN26_09530 [Chitinophagaceae bacterium]
MAEPVKHVSTVLNKILIPVITTVLGATAIYFLGFNKKSSASEAEVEKATVNAWRSFVSSSNINYKLTGSISTEYEEKIKTTVEEKGIEAIGPVVKEFKNELFRESNKLKVDIENILKRSDDIDEGFVSMLKRTLANLNDQEEKTEEFLSRFVSLAKADIDQQEKSKKLEKEIEKFMAMAEHLEERSATEAEDIADVLSKKYDRPFDLNDLLVFVEYNNKKKQEKKEEQKEDDPAPVKEEKNDPAPIDPNNGTNYVNNNNDKKEVIPTSQQDITAADLTGNWVMNDGKLNLNKDMSLYWSFNAKGYTTGTWKVADGQLQMNNKNPDTKKMFYLVYYISLNGNSLTLTNASNASEVYSFKKN